MSAKSGFIGLVTATGEVTAPAGALRKADNVVVRKLGVLETRSAMPFMAQAYSSPSSTFRNAAAFGASTIYEDQSGWKNASGVSLSVPTNVYRSSFTPSKLRGDSFSTVLARGNLYVPHSRGVVKLESPAGAQWQDAGLSHAHVVPAGFGVLTPGTSLVYGDTWAYRFVMRRRDSNGLILQSRPTGSSVVTVKAANGTWDVSLTVTGVVLGAMGINDAVEVYRTRKFPGFVQNDEEYSLVKELHGSDASSTLLFGQWTYYNFAFVDAVPDINRGRALYTSPSRGGEESSNDRPPACGCIEAFRGAVFFGNVESPQYTLFSYSVSPLTVSALANQASGIGVRQITGTLTNGSATITGASPTTGLRVGQLVAGYFPDQSVITSIVGSTITVSQPYPGATLTVSNLLIQDVVHVRYGAVTAYVTTDSDGEFFVNRLGTYMAGLVDGLRITPPMTNYGTTLSLRSHDPGGPVFSVAATHGSEYSPPLPEPTATFVDSTKDVYPNGCIYSNADEPEHVPPKNFFYVGDRTAAILGMKATRDVIYIIKEDGVWRVSGFNGDWRPDPVDLTIRCVLPSSIQALGDAVYFLSNQGIARVSENGTEIISEPIRDQVVRLVDDCILNWSALGYYKLTGLDGVAAAVDNRNNEYILLVGSNQLDTGGNALVFNASTNAWTTATWKTGSNLGSIAEIGPPSGLGAHHTNKPIVMHTGCVRAPDYSMVPVDGENSLSAHDGSLSINVTFASEYTTTNGVLVAVTLTYTPNAALQIDDIITDSAGNTFRVIGIPAPNRATVDWVGATVLPAVGAATAYRSISCTVQPHGFSDPALVGKVWTHAVWAFSRLLGAFKIRGSFSSAEPTVEESTQTVTEDLAFRTVSGLESGHHLGTLLRHPVPRLHQRSWMLRPQISWIIAAGKVVLEAFGAEERSAQSNRSQTNSSGSS